MQTTMTTHTIVPRDEWLAARAALLEREKDHTRLGDDLARQRRELPWVRVEKQYLLQTASGPQTLAELFDGRSQLLIYHFMFGPSYADGCPVNSSIADAFDSLIPHLKARDVTLIAVSGASIEKLVAYRERMGWCFNWASSYESDFNADLGYSSSLEQTRKAIEPMLSDLPPVAFRNASKAGTDIYGYLTELFGFTAFALEDGTVHQTYSTTATARHSVMDSPCLPTRSSGAHSHGWVEATKFCSDTEGSEDQAWAWYRRASKTLVSNFFRQVNHN